MKVNLKKQKTLAIIVAVAILWLFVGSLVNFHQHRIFGKQLIEETNPFIKPKNEKSFFVQIHSFSPSQNDNNLIVFSLVVASLIIATGIVTLWRKIFYNSFSLALKVSEFPHFRKFRGPPSI